MTAGDLSAGRRRGGNSASIWKRLQFRIAGGPAERLAALRLVHQRYSSSKLIEPCQLKLRVTPQHLLPTTTIFVGIADKSVFCTISLIRDSEHGLPLDTIYAPEVQRLRKQGRQIAEVSSLAFAECGTPGSFRKAFVQLTRIMAQFARHHGVTSLLMATNPRHQMYYQRLMGFRRIGGVKSYPSVSNHPAVACLLDFDEADANNPPLYDAVFGTPLPAEDLQPNFITSAEERLMKLASTQTNRLLPISA